MLNLIKSFVTRKPDNIQSIKKEFNFITSAGDSSELFYRKNILGGDDIEKTIRQVAGVIFNNCNVHNYRINESMLTRIVTDLIKRRILPIRSELMEAGKLGFLSAEQRGMFANNIVITDMHRIMLRLYGVAIVMELYKLSGKAKLCINLRKANRDYVELMSAFLSQNTLPSTPFRLVYHFDANRLDAISRFVISLLNRLNIVHYKITDIVGCNKQDCGLLLNDGKLLVIGAELDAPVTLINLIGIAAK